MGLSSNGSNNGSQSVAAMEEEANQSQPSDTPPDLTSFFRIRVRAARSVLAALRADSGTGPDEVSTRVLTACVRESALPIALIAYLILQHGRWPEIWC